MYIPPTVIGRAISSAYSAIHSFPAERRAREVAKAELEHELRALDEVATRLTFDIDLVEFTGSIGYYVNCGANFTEALRKYRVLLENGGRLPARKSVCLKQGRRLRYRLNIPTEEDKAHSDRVRLRVDWIGICLLYTFCAILIGFAANLLITQMAIGDFLILITCSVGVCFVARTFQKSTQKRLKGKR